MLSRGQIGVDAVLRRGQSHLFESGPVRLGELLEREVLQRRAAPQRQAGAQRDPGIDVSSGDEMFVALLGEGGETLRIDPFGINLQDVTAVAGFDRCVDKQATELRHLGLQGIGGSAGGRFTPQQIGQSIGGNRLTGAQQQRCQEGAKLASPQLDGVPPVVEDLERSQHPEFHVATLVRWTGHGSGRVIR